MSRGPMSVITIDTRATWDAQDVTDLVAAAIPDDAGNTLLLSTPHTTVALVVAPADEPMLRDFIRLAKRWPADLGPFEHWLEDNPNAEAHIQSAAFGTRLLVSQEEGSLVLGTYQRIVLLEFDGPRTRTIDVRGVT